MTNIDKQHDKQLLTTANTEWEDWYVQGKMSNSPVSWWRRAFTASENILDKFLRPRSVESVEEIHQCAGHLVAFDDLGMETVVVGCGPQPETVLAFAALGYRVIGIEPVNKAILKAKNYLEGRAEVICGTAEKMDLPDSSQSMVVMENVLEHVDSVPKSLAESYRILKCGGVLFIRTANRTRFSLTGINWEFTRRFYNWFPAIVKESYVFAQLHYRPELAHYSPRPAVHWLSYAELCRLGRDVGFARFYSPFDLLPLKNNVGSIRSTRSRYDWRRNPWIRALAVSQMTGDIFMWKRSE